MSSLATSERAALCDLLAEVGPDAPTLCTGWTTRDLAAHLVVREGRPDAAAGLVVGRLADHTKSVQDRTAERPFGELVATVRNGPPIWNPMRLGAVADRTNALEYLVHHEDIRRAAPGWEPRKLPDAVQDETWERLRRMAKVSFRSSPVGVVLRRPDGTMLTAHPGSPTVMLTGDPVELALLAFGRDQHRVRIDGDPQDVTAFLAAPRKL